MTKDLVPRIEFEDIEPSLKELFRPRVERLGYLGEFFRVMSAQPETMKGFFTIKEFLNWQVRVDSLQDPLDHFLIVWIVVDHYNGGG